MFAREIIKIKNFSKIAVFFFILSHGVTKEFFYSSMGPLAREDHTLKAVKIIENKTDC